MVSQEFMNILHKQCKHNTPIMTSSGASSNSEGMSLNVHRYESFNIKVEEELDYVASAQSDVGMASLHTNLKTEVEDCSNAMEPSLAQVMVSRESSSETSPHQASKGKEIVSIYMIESPQQHIKEEKALPLFNKRIIKKKQIYDPSDTSISSQKNQRKKSSFKETSKRNSLQKEMVNFPESPQQHIKEEKALPHFNKRLVKKKQIYDPSDIYISSQKNQMEKSSLMMKKTRCTSRTHKHYMETPKMEKKITGDKICVYCGKHIKREDYMRLHLMKHTGETPHKCPKCPKAYRYRWRLTQHIRLHNKNFPYHCPYCNYCGNRSDYLSSHVKRVHHRTKIAAIAVGR